MSTEQEEEKSAPPETDVSTLAFVMHSIHVERERLRAEVRRLRAEQIRVEQLIDRCRTNWETELLKVQALPSRDRARVWAEYGTLKAASPPSSPPTQSGSEPRRVPKQRPP